MSSRPVQSVKTASCGGHEVVSLADSLIVRGVPCRWVLPIEQVTHTLGMQRVEVATKWKHLVRYGVQSRFGLDVEVDERWIQRLSPVRGSSESDCLTEQGDSGCHVVRFSSRRHVATVLDAGDLVGRTFDDLPEWASSLVISWIRSCCSRHGGDPLAVWYWSFAGALVLMRFAGRVVDRAPDMIFFVSCDVVVFARA